MAVVRSIALTLLLCLSTGCAFRPQVAGMAVEYNEFVAEATNRQTVVNILRARSREPLHFTSFSKVLGTARVEGTAGLDLAVNGNGGERLPQSGGGAFATSRRTMGATNWTPKLGVRINSGTDFEIGINATDDFWKGITTPVAPATIVHLLRQGWERDLISYLFVQKIDFTGRITDPTGKVVATLPLRVLRNAPDYEFTVGPFTSLVQCRTLYYALSESNQRSEFVITFSENMEVSETMRRAACASFEQGLRNDFQKAMQTQNVRLAEREPRDLGDPSSARKDTDADPFRGRANYVAGASSDSSTTQPNGAGFTATNYFQDLVPAGYNAELLIDVSMRSVEGMINYLGEYVRTVNERPLAYGRCKDGQYRQCIPLIVIKPAEEARDVEPFISVDYKRRSYIVPLSGEDIRTDAGFSSQVIGLVQTMLNLHRSAKDLPSTPLVRVIN